MPDGKIFRFCLILLGLPGILWSAPNPAGSPNTVTPPSEGRLPHQINLHALTKGSFTRTADGVIIYPDTTQSGKARAVKLQVVTDNIIHVISSPARNISNRESLITVYAANPL